MDSPRRQRSISLCQPHSNTRHPSRVGVPTRLPDALGCRASTTGGQGATLSTFPLVPLTREPTCTQAIDPATSGSTLTPADISRPSRSSGHFPGFPWSGSPWLAHGSPLHGDWFPNLTGLLLGAFGFPSHPMSHSPMPHPVTGPLSASRGLPTPPGCFAAPSHPSSRVYTPLGRQQPYGAGPLDPHPSGDRFVRLARVAPFPPPPLSPVPHPHPFPASHATPVPWATRPFLSHPLFPASCFFFTGPPATLWRGPTGSAAFPGPVRVPSTGRPPPAPFHLRGLLPSGPVVGPSSCPPRPALPVPFPNLVTRRCWYCSLFVFFFGFFFCADRGPSSVLLPRLVPPPPARFVPQALLRRCGVLFVFFLFFFVLSAVWFPPPCMHAQQHCTGHLSRLPSVLLSSPIALLWRGPGRSLAMPGGRSSLGSHSFKPFDEVNFLTPPSPSLCVLPALLLLFSCSVCSPLVVPAPWLYLARSHAPQGLCPVLRPVGRLGRPPQIPLLGTPPSSSSAGRPSISSLMVGRGGRCGSMRVIGMAFLCVRQCAPLRHCWPPASPPSRALPPLRVLPWCLVSLFCCFFFGCPRAACSSPCYRCLTAACPLTRPSPLPSTVSLPILPALFVSPLCLCGAVTRVCHPRALPLPLSVVPTLFPDGSPTLVLYTLSLSLTSSGMPRCPVPGGWGGLFADWTVALPEDWHDAGRLDSTTAILLTLPARVNSSPP